MSKRNAVKEAIMKKYKAFIRPKRGLQQTLKGWFSILDKLFESIQKLNPPETFEIVQVKEKFGGLRVYTEGSSDEIEKLHDNGWLKTLCDDCAIEAGYELNVVGKKENEVSDGKTEN